MIVLDTNVVSELMRDAPDEYVMRWMGEQPETTLYITSVTQAELLYGIERLPAGKRRAGLQRDAEELFNDDFAGRILPFGSEAARAYAQITVARSRADRPISQFDAQIAAITLMSRASLATRDIEGYQGCGVKLIDPWND